jgi:excisionase family DNA binding protein
MLNSVVDRSALLTVSQAAEAFSATSQTIRNWIRSGQLGSVRIGNRFFVPAAEVQRVRGSLPASQGGPTDSPWDLGEGSITLQRRTKDNRPKADPTDGLLGA